MWRHIKWAANGCWLWSSVQPFGLSYGTIRLGGAGSRHEAAPRFVYRTLVGPIPEGLEIDHLCRNRACVFPGHLEPVTHRENMLRGDTFQRRNARKTHCLRGHPFDEENTIWRRIPGSGGLGRSCRECTNAKQRRRRARLKREREAVV